MQSACVSLRVGFRDFWLVFSKMGCAMSSDEKMALHRSKTIDRHLRAEAVRTRTEIRLLILGNANAFAIVTQKL